MEWSFFYISGSRVLSLLAFHVQVKFFLAKWTLELLLAVYFNNLRKNPVQVIFLSAQRTLYIMHFCHGNLLYLKLSQDIRLQEILQPYSRHHRFRYAEPPGKAAGIDRLGRINPALCRQNVIARRI